MNAVITNESNLKIKMAELVTPNTPRPSRYTDDRSTQGNLYERFKIEQAQARAQQQSLQETRQ